MSGHPRSIAVVGAGVVGLTCALLLSESGCEVTIIARNMPGDDSTEWASPWAGALLAAHPDGDAEMQRTSLGYFKALSKHGLTVGIKSMPITELYDDRDRSSIWYKDLFPDFEFIDTESLPAPAKIGMRYTVQVVNPEIFLPWLVSELTKRNVKLIQRHVSSLQEARQLVNTDIVVNATGLGAADLANDEKVYPVRGQTMFVKSDFDRVVIFQGSSYTYAIPRPGTGGVILGGVTQVRSTSTTVDAEVKKDILRRVNHFTDNAFSWINPEQDVRRDIVGFRPFREGGIRVECEEDIIHAYGAGSLGFLYCFGMAEKVRDLVRRKTQPNKSRL